MSVISDSESPTEDHTLRLHAAIVLLKGELSEH